MKTRRRVGTWTLAALIVIGGTSAATGAGRVPEVATFYGGPGFDAVVDTAVAPDGSVYVVGTTSSGLETTPGVVQEEFGGVYDGFVIKLTPDGSLVYATYLGGADPDRAAGVAVDGEGDAYVTGWTLSTDFHVTPGAFQTERQNVPDPNCFEHCEGDAYVVKLSEDGTALEYGTYLGGNHDEDGVDIVVDDVGAAHVVGGTDSSNFPTTPGAFEDEFQSEECQTDFCRRDVFVTKLAPDGSGLEGSTYFGGLNWDITSGVGLDPDGNVVIGGLTTSPDLPFDDGSLQTTPGRGNDSFVAALSGDGTRLEYGTYVAYRGDEIINGLAVDRAGRILATGFTSSRGFETTSNAPQRSRQQGGADAFVLRLAPRAERRSFSTFFGGSDFDGGFGIHHTGDGRIAVSGFTSSPDLPLAGKPIEKTEQGQGDVYFAEFDPRRSRVLYSTYLGGNMPDGTTDVALARDGSVYIVGDMQSNDFPLAGRPLRKKIAGANDGYIVRLKRGTAQRVDVTEDGFEYRYVIVQEGGTVRWHFNSGGDHTVSDASGQNRFGSGKRPAGSDYFFTFDQPGTYKVADRGSGARMRAIVAPRD